MNDNSFLNLTSNNVLAKIDIDPRLVETFKRVMAKQQEYFNANGYTSERDYKNFFEQYLLKDMPDKLKILISDEPSKKGADGFYRHRQGVQEIHIDSSCLTYPTEYLDATLSHEFIHFLVMRGLENVKYPDPEIKNGGFINEAITEMLNQQLYPNSHSYKPQVNMLKFANLLTGKVNNYSLFLQGKVDSKRTSSSWQNFVQNVTKYHHEWADKGFVMTEAVEDSNYIYAQRQLIQNCIPQHLISSFEEYDRYLSIIEQRPAPDTEWIEKFKQGMDNGLLNNMNIPDPLMRKFLENKLKEYRTLSSKLKEFGNQDFIEFEIAGHKIAIDKNQKVYNSSKLPYQLTWYPNNNTLEFKTGNNVININMETADFSKGRADILKKLKEIPDIFSKSLRKDIEILNKNINIDDLKKIEKFQLPNINQKVSPIYIATYTDHLEILNSPIELGSIENVKQNEYIGMTSKTNGAIYQKDLGQISNGLTFSTLTEQNLDKEIQSYFYKQYKNSLTEEQLNQAIGEYRKSSEYDPDEEDNIKELKDAAVGYYSRMKLASLNEEERKKISNKIIEEKPKFIVSAKDGKLDVSLLYGKEFISAYKGNSVEIVNKNANALFNDYFFNYQNNLSKQVVNDNVKISTDQNNNILTPTKNKSQFVEMKNSIENMTVDDLEKQFNRKYGLPDEPYNPKKELEEEKRELRRKKFYEKVKSLGLNNNDMDLENLFKEQEMLRGHIEQVEQFHQNKLM